MFNELKNGLKILVGQAVFKFKIVKILLFDQ